MNIQVEFMKDVIEDVRRRLEKIRWVKSYEIYAQNIQRVELSALQEGKAIIQPMRIRERRKSGLSLKLKSHSNRIREYAIGMSALNQITETITETITEPGTNSPVDESEEEALTPPRRLCIEGDDFLSKDATEMEFHQLFGTKVHDASSSFDFEIETVIEREIIGITNSLSPDLISCSQKLFSTIIGRDRDNEYLDAVTRFASRNINGHKLKFEDSLVWLNDKLVFLKTSSHQKVNRTNTPNILFTPQIVGKMIRSFVESANLQGKYVESVLGSHFKIIDDPTLIEGLFSTYIDDTGNKAEITNIASPESNRNYFKFRSYESFHRMYEFIAHHHISNLVLTGGVGRGEEFTQRKQQFILAQKGTVTAFGRQENIGFIIRVQEAEFWQSGLRMASVEEFTVIIDARELFDNMTLSSEKELSYEIHRPGCTYTGWMWVPKEIIRLQ